MFINLSNHKSSAWSEEQIEAARKFGEIEDMQFPAINPNDSTEEVKVLAKSYLDKIIQLNPKAVMVQGEFTFTVLLIEFLKQQGIKTVVACSDRITQEHVDENGDTVKRAIFKFVQFREL